ncbi:MAG: type II toxin-antitoxin system VapC family toxin [Deltaproteobacteria bacterium]|nr:type II toxin-antitoxin system VapC family toxin [Deltaproteobacteria bacterium]
MKIAIDSNRYTDFCKGVAPVVEAIKNATEIHIPLIVIAEQRAGFAYSTNREKNERTLTKFLNNDGVFILSPDDQTTFFYADLYSYLRKKGKPITTLIPTNDLWIAALVLQHNLVLFDRDSDFDQLPQLARLPIA